MTKRNNLPNPRGGVEKEAEYNILAEKIVAYHNGYLDANRGKTRDDSVRAIANYSGYSQKQVKEVLRYAERSGGWDVRSNNKVKDYEIERMNSLYDSGKNLREIAEELGRSEKTIKKYFPNWKRYSEKEMIVDDINYGGVSGVISEYRPESLLGRFRKYTGDIAGKVGRAAAVLGLAFLGSVNYANDSSRVDKNTGNRAGIERKCAVNDIEGSILELANYNDDGMGNRDRAGKTYFAVNEPEQNVMDNGQKKRQKLLEEKRKIDEQLLELRARGKEDERMPAKEGINFANSAQDYKGKAMGIKGGVVSGDSGGYAGRASSRLDLGEGISLGLREERISLNNSDAERDSDKAEFAFETPNFSISGIYGRGEKKRESGFERTYVNSDGLDETDTNEQDEKVNEDLEKARISLNIGSKTTLGMAYGQRSIESKLRDRTTADISGVVDVGGFLVPVDEFVDVITNVKTKTLERDLALYGEHDLNKFLRMRLYGDMSTTNVSATENATRIIDEKYNGYQASAGLLSTNFLSGAGYIEAGRLWGDEIKDKEIINAFTLQEAGKGVILGFGGGSYNGRRHVNLEFLLNTDPSKDVMKDLIDYKLFESDIYKDRLTSLSFDNAYTIGMFDRRLEEFAKLSRETNSPVLSLEASRRKNDDKSSIRHFIAVPLSDKFSLVNYGTNNATLKQNGVELNFAPKNGIFFQGDSLGVGAEEIDVKNGDDERIFMFNLTIPFGGETSGGKASR